MDYILSSTSNIDTSSNEMITTHSINRNFEKLLNNDKLLDSLRQHIYDGTISPWSRYNTYKLGDIVWFRRNEKIYILKSIINDNKNVPESIIKNNRQYFNDSGWYDMNEYSTFFQDDLSVAIGRYFTSMMTEDHENNASYHKYGEMRLSSIDDFILKKDLSNIKEDREHIFYPYETHFLKRDNCIRYGQYRKWDCGILEYDMVFQLGYTGNKITYNKLEYDEVCCNTLELSDDRYYNEDSDKDILSCNESERNMVVFGDHIEKNRNDFVNSYSSTMKFQQPFKDNNYMIFGSDIRIQERNTDSMSIDKGLNTLVYTNKLSSQVDPVYIMYAEDGNKNPRKSGLITNSFHCHIIGRWK